MPAGESGPLQLVASEGRVIERSKRPREDDRRLRGRMMEFVGVRAVVLCSALGVADLAEQVLSPSRKLKQRWRDTPEPASGAAKFRMSRLANRVQGTLPQSLR